MNITIVNVGVSLGTERLARTLFGPDQIPDVLEVLSWYDLVGRVGVKGAEQIERSNDKLFGNPARKDLE